MHKRKHQELGLCKLCLQEKKLAKSHIFPRFAFKLILNEKSRLFGGLVGSFKNWNNLQIMPFEKRTILCIECEGILSKEEGYYKRNVFSKSPVLFFSTPNADIPIHYFSSLNNERIKLFFLGILWKAHHSSLKQFVNVSLEQSLEAMIRTELRTSSLTQDWPQLSAMKLEPHSNLNKAVVGIKRIQNTFCFQINDVIVLIHIRQDQLSIKMKGHWVKKDRPWALMHVPKNLEMELIGKMFGEAYNR